MFTDRKQNLPGAALAPRRLLVIMTGATALLWFAGFRNFHVDDTGIYAHIMRNWLSSGNATFNTTDPAFPITSYLWFLWNMTFLQMLKVDAIYEFLRAMSVLFYFATWVVFYAAVKRFVHSPYIVAGTTLLLITDEIAMEYAASGMDTAMGIFMSAFSLYLFGAWTEGVGSGLAIVTRPEGVFLAFAQFLTRLLHRDWRCLFLSAIAMIAIILAVMLSITPFTSSLSNTVQMKSSDFGLFLNAMPNVQRLFLIVGSFSFWPILLIVLFGRQQVGQAVGSMVREPVVQVSLLFVLITCGSYIALLNGDFLKARYVSIVTPFVYLLLGIVADRTLGKTPNRAQYWLVVWVVNLVLILTAGLANARTNYDTYLRRLTEVELLGKYAQPSDAVFTSAIGVIGYETNLQVLDAAGLATPAAIKPIRPEDCTWMLETYQPDFLIRLAPVQNFSDITTFAWPECHLDFIVKFVDSADMLLFDDGWFVWRAPTMTRVALYQITNWRPRVP